MREKIDMPTLMVSILQWKHLLKYHWAPHRDKYVHFYVSDIHGFKNVFVDRVGTKITEMNLNGQRFHLLHKS